ncbi:MAG: VOC family protein, partial [Anaerolineae bacterium]|nr:VOC family protein [Anaerolineae bacterium]
MAFRLDHIIIAVHDLDGAIRDYHALGFTVNYGGRHASGTTHNALIGFQDGSYLELMAVTGEQPQPGVNAVDYSPLAQGDEGLSGFALLSNDLITDAAALREKGAAISVPAPGSRRRTDGVEIRWLTAAVAGHMSPFFVEDQTPRDLRVLSAPDVTRHAYGVTGVRELEVLVAQLGEAEIANYARLFGISPWRSGDTFVTFLLEGVKFKLIPATTPEQKAYLTGNKTPLY